MATFHIDPDSPLTAWGQVQKSLQHSIESSELAPDERLPSETKLAEQFGVSRATVRRAISSLIAVRLVYSKRGSGTFVAPAASPAQFDVNLLRPWRDQLLATGHVARSRLITDQQNVEVPADLIRFVEYDNPHHLRFGLHLQEVDGTPIAITESWSPENDVGTGLHRAQTAPVVASGTVRITFAGTSQTAALRTTANTALFEITTCSRLRETGELVELARTSWVASRVRLGYSRALTVGQIDMTELRTFDEQSHSRKNSGSPAS